MEDSSLSFSSNISDLYNGFSCFLIKKNVLVLSLCHLVRESGEPGKKKSYLPPDKQYLITRNGKTIPLVLSLIIFLLVIVKLWLMFSHYKDSKAMTFF